MNDAAKIAIAASQSHANGVVDAAASAINGPISSGADLIESKGTGRVLLAFVIFLCLVFMGAIFSGGWLIRSDFLANAEKDRANHDAALKAFVDQVKEKSAQDREDRKTEREMFRDATETMRDCAKSIKKSVTYLERIADKAEKQ